MNNKTLKLKHLLKEGLDAVLITSVSNIVYLIGYFGFSYFEREAFLVITNTENYLITDGRYSEAVADIPGFKLIETSLENTIDKVFENLSRKIKKIGIEENDLSVLEYRKLRKYFRTANLSDLQNLRVIKNSSEVKSIEKACKLGDETFDFILNKIKLGVTEKQIALEIEFFIKRAGADISFPPIVAFSKNSSIPHHKTSGQRLKINSPVLLDFGIKVENYCSDMTRTVFFGKADDKFKKIYNTILDAQKLTIEQLNNLTIAEKQIKASYIDDIARKHIINQGFPSIPHSLGHGIGIEVHEPPRLSSKSKDILKEGMVFSIEPGIYISGYGGVRIEDLVVLEKKGACLFTHSPKHLIEI